MSTISVPLPPELEAFINDQVKSGRAANKAHVVRYALQRLSEEEAIADILRAQQEPTVRGNLRELVKKYK